MKILAVSFAVLALVATGGAFSFARTAVSAEAPAVTGGCTADFTTFSCVN